MVGGIQKNVRPGMLELELKRPEEVVQASLLLVQKPGEGLVVIHQNEL